MTVLPNGSINPTLVPGLVASAIPLLNEPILLNSKGAITLPVLSTIPSKLPFFKTMKPLLNS